MQFPEFAGVRRLNRSQTHRMLASAMGMVCLGYGSASAQVYTPTEIGTLGGDASFAHGLNEAGVVVGYARNLAGENRAFLYSGGSPQDLGTLGGSDSQAFAINNNNVVVGFSRTATALEHAFSYSGGTMTDLGTLGGSSSYGFGVNDTGQVVGGSTRQLDLQYRAYRLTGTTMTDLGSLGGFLGGSESTGIDSDGTVVGWTSLPEFTQQAFRYSGTTMTTLGTLGGNYSYAQAIKNGVIVGGAFEAGDTVFRAVRWSGGSIENLGTLPGQPSSIAYALNSTGQVVGKSDAGSDETSLAFLHLGGTMVDLNDLIAPNSGWILQQARGINDAGQIAGFGTYNGQGRGFILNLTGKIWTNPAGGAFTTTTNWYSAGAPNNTQSAAFPLNSTYSVSVGSDVASKSLSVPRGKVTFDAAGTSTYTVSEAVHVSPGATMNWAGPGSLSAAILQSEGVVQVLGGEVHLRSNGGTSVAADLRFGGSADALTGRLDITNNALVIDYDDVSPIISVREQIRSGRAAGGWDGAGIVSLLASPSALGIGYAEASALFNQFPATFAGRQVDSTSVLLQLRRYGDANLDGLVNLADFNVLAGNFGTSDRFWNTGDFNYDGLVNLADFNLLAANFGLSAAADGPTPDDWSALAMVVPEPGMVGAVVALSLMSLRRRRVQKT